MKLLLIGQTVVDHIHKSNEDLIQPGGIFYSAAGLLAAKERNDSFTLITSLDRINKPKFEKVYNYFDLSFSNEVEKIPTVHLKLHNEKERDECYQNYSTEAIELNNDIVLNDFDGILINMITGFELKINMLQRIREEYNKLIYLDIHSLARGIDENNIRKFRNIPDAEDWIRNANIIQANENELKTFGFKGNELQIAEKVLSLGPKILLVTKGSAGVRAYFKVKDEILSTFQPAIKLHSINHVGCGDIFGAIFFSSYIKNQNIFRSLQKANHAAGIVTSYSSIDELLNLKNDLIK